MSVKKRILPPGWYPDTEKRTRNLLREWERETPVDTAEGIGGIVPHAGWMFSGKLAFSVLRRLSAGVDTVVVIGGHLPKGGGILASTEDHYETPVGLLPIDKELLTSIAKQIAIREDVFADNTVEVQLPMVKYLFSDISVLGLRAEPTEEAVALGRSIAQSAREQRKNVAVVGSTDLTHYGNAYGFAPKGTGKDALSWVKEVNDKRVIDALLNFDYSSAIKHANQDRAACSIGGAVAAASYAEVLGHTKGHLLDYYTSSDIQPGSSFVGYVGIIYEDNDTTS